MQPEQSNDQSPKITGKKIRAQQSPFLKKNKLDKLQKLYNGVIQKQLEQDSAVQRLEQEKLALWETLNAKKTTEHLAIDKHQEESSSTDQKSQLVKVALQETIQLQAEQNEILKLRQQLEAMTSQVTLKRGEAVKINQELEGSKTKAEALKLLLDDKLAKKAKISIEIDKLQKQKQEHLDQQLLQKNIKERLDKSLAAAKTQLKTRSEAFCEAQSQAKIVDQMTEQISKLQSQLRQAKAENDNLMTAKAKSDEEFNSGKKTVADLKETGKKKEERISVLKEKIEAMQRRKQELKRQQDLLIKEAAEENKKMEEKVPEQIVAFEARNEQLRKELKKVNEEYEKERSETEKLVPPAVIASMNQKITKIIKNNEEAIKITKENQSLAKENKELNVLKETLHWGENQRLKEVTVHIVEQEENNREIGEKVAQLKKKSMQVAQCLNEYIKQYPQYTTRLKSYKEKAAEKAAAEKAAAERTAAEKVVAERVAAERAAAERAERALEKREAQKQSQAAKSENLDLAKINSTPVSGGEKQGKSGKKKKKAKQGKVQEDDQSEQKPANTQTQQIEAQIKPATDVKPKVESKPSGTENKPDAAEQKAVIFSVEENKCPIIKQTDKSVEESKAQAIWLQKSKSQPVQQKKPKKKKNR